MKHDSESASREPRILPRSEFRARGPLIWKRKPKAELMNQAKTGLMICEQELDVTLATAAKAPTTAGQKERLRWD